MTGIAGGWDLHIHTTHSDGGCSPGEVVRAAANLGLRGLAITDHDTISALSVARPEAERLGLELVPGCEITTELDGREYHLLAYFFREDHDELAQMCLALRQKRDERIAAMVRKLHDLEFRVDLQAIRETFPRATIGRKHLADWLVKSGQVATREQVFAAYLGDQGQAQVPKPRMAVAEAIALVRRAGGVAALAHPPYDLREETLKQFVSLDLKAIEVDGPSVNKSRKERLGLWATRHSLVPIAGSDFHANDRPGRWIGSITTPSESVERLRSLCS